MNNISNSKTLVKRRPGPLSKTKNKEKNIETLKAVINDDSDDQIEFVFLDIDDNKPQESITVSADSFNSFEKLVEADSSNPLDIDSKIEKKVRTYNRSNKLQTESNNDSKTNVNSNNKPTIELTESNNASKTNSNNKQTIELTRKNSTEIPININGCSKNFEEIVIKGEIHETEDNNVKNTDKIDGKVGEPLSSEVSRETSPVLKQTSPVEVKKTNRVFIIKNLAGKKVTLIPKTTPVFLKSPTKPAIDNKVKKADNTSGKLENKLEKSVNKAVPLNKTLKIIKPVQQKSVKLPLPQSMKISDVNKSQKYFSEKQNYYNLKIQKTESLSRPQKVIEIDLTGESKGMKNNVQSNTMPNFSKILQVLTGSPSQSPKPSKSLEDTKIPIYVDCQTQTDSVVILKDKSVQTEVYMPSPTQSIEDLPNITNLLEYVFSTPKYSTGLDEVKKSDLIDMSKNIVMKGKIMSQVPKGEDALKKQLFMDLKDCATFDFLGNKPIHNAVIENNLKFLKRQIFALKLRKISVDIENNQGQTALQLAVSHNCNIEVITALLLNGASANILDNEGNTLIHLAVINSTHFVIELLLKYLVDPVKEINRKNDEGLTALMIASIDSKPEMVDMLLRNKADPNLRDEKSGRTALFHAVELNCNFVINLLLKYRADPKVRNYFGLTALDAAKDLDMADSKILEAEKESNSLSNQTSVIVNMSALNKPVEPAAGSKRGRPSGPRQNDDAKKPKISFVSSYQKVQITAKNPATNNGGRRKKK